MASTERDRRDGLLYTTPKALYGGPVGNKGTGPRFGPPPKSAGSARARSPAVAFAARSPGNAGSVRPGGYAQLAQMRAGQVPSTGVQWRSKTPAAQRTAPLYSMTGRRATTPPSGALTFRGSPLPEDAPGAGRGLPASSRQPYTPTAHRMPAGNLPPAGVSPRTPTGTVVGLSTRPSALTPASRAATATSTHRAPPARELPTLYSAYDTGARAERLEYFKAIPGTVPRAAGLIPNAHATAVPAPQRLYAPEQVARTPSPADRAILAVPGGSSFVAPEDDWLNQYEKSSMGFLRELDAILGGLNKLGGVVGASAEAGAPPLQLPAAPGPRDAGRSAHLSQEGPSHLQTGSDAFQRQTPQQQISILREPAGHLRQQPAVGHGSDGRLALPAGQGAAAGAASTSATVQSPRPPDLTPSVTASSFGATLGPIQALQQLLLAAQREASPRLAPSASIAGALIQRGISPESEASPRQAAGAELAQGGAAGERAAGTQSFPAAGAVSVPAGTLSDLWSVLQASSRGTARLVADLAATRREVEAANERAEEADALARAFQQQLVARQQHVASWQTALIEMEEREEAARAQLLEAQQQCDELAQRAQTAEHVAATAQIRLERLVARRVAELEAGGSGADGNWSEHGVQQHQAAQKLQAQLQQLQADLATAQARATRAELELAVARNKALIAHQELAAEENRARRASLAAAVAREELGRTRCVLELMGGDHDRLQQRFGALSSMRGPEASQADCLPHGSPAYAAATVHQGNRLFPRPAARSHSASAATAAADDATTASQPDASRHPASTISSDDDSSGVLQQVSPVALPRAGLDPPTAPRSGRGLGRVSDSDGSAASIESPRGGGGSGSSISSAGASTLAPGIRTLADVEAIADCGSPVQRRLPSASTHGRQRWGSLLLLAPGEVPMEGCASLRYGQNPRRNSLSHEPGPPGSAGVPKAAGSGENGRQQPGAHPASGRSDDSGGVDGNAAAAVRALGPAFSPMGGGAVLPGRGRMSRLGTHDGAVGRPSPAQRALVYGGRRQSPGSGDDDSDNAEGDHERLLYKTDLDLSRAAAEALQAMRLGSTSVGGVYRGKVGGQHAEALIDELLPLSRAPSSATRPRRASAVRTSQGSITARSGIVQPPPAAGAAAVPTVHTPPRAAPASPVYGTGTEAVRRLAPPRRLSEDIAPTGGGPSCSSALNENGDNAVGSATPQKLHRERQATQVQASVALADLRRRVSLTSPAAAPEVEPGSAMAAPRPARSSQASACASRTSASHSGSGSVGSGGNGNTMGTSAGPWSAAAAVMAPPRVPIMGQPSATAPQSTAVETPTVAAMRTTRSPASRLPLPPGFSVATPLPPLEKTYSPTERPARQDGSGDAGTSPLGRSPPKLRPFEAAASPSSGTPPRPPASKTARAGNPNASPAAAKRPSVAPVPGVRPDHHASPAASTPIPGSIPRAIIATATPVDVTVAADRSPPTGYQTSHLNDLYESRQWPPTGLAAAVGSDTEQGGGPMFPLLAQEGAPHSMSSGLDSPGSAPVGMAPPPPPQEHSAMYPAPGAAVPGVEATGRSEEGRGELPLTPRSRMLSPSQLDSHLVRPSVSDSMATVGSVDGASTSAATAASIGGSLSFTPSRAFRQAVQALNSGKAPTWAAGREDALLGPHTADLSRGGLPSESSLGHSRGQGDGLANGHAAHAVVASVLAGGPATAGPASANLAVQPAPVGTVTPPKPGPSRSSEAEPRSAVQVATPAGGRPQKPTGHVNRGGHPWWMRLLPLSRRPRSGWHPEGFESGIAPLQVAGALTGVLATHASHTVSPSRGSGSPLRAASRERGTPAAAQPPPLQPASASRAESGSTQALRPTQSVGGVARPTGESAAAAPATIAPGRPDDTQRSPEGKSQGKGAGELARLVRSALLHVSMWSGGVALGVLLVLGAAGVVEGALGLGDTGLDAAGHGSGCGCPPSLLAGSTSGAKSWRGCRVGGPDAMGADGVEKVKGNGRRRCKD